MPEPHSEIHAVSRRLRRRHLTHLTPGKVRIGSTGIFAGEWDFGATRRYAVGYVGVLERRWNGWAEFTCTRDVAAAIVADHTAAYTARHDWFVADGHTSEQAATLTAAAMPRLWWDGDTVLHDESGISGVPDAVIRYTPDIDGNYEIAAGIWTWDAVRPWDCERIVGTIPARGRQQRWLPLRHSDLRIPNHRLAVTDLTAHDSDAGVVTAATLALDDLDIAVLRIDPDGTHSWLRPPNMVRSQQIQAFVSACRHHGRAVTERDVLDALVNEAHTDAFLTAARHAGATAVRLCDADGRTLDLQPVPAGSDVADLRAAFAVRSDPDLDATGATWAVWSGNAWHRFYDIPAADTGTGTHTP